MDCQYYTIRKFEKSGMSRDEAINSAIDECIGRGILKEFLLEPGSEVHNMLFAEFNMEKELKVAEEIGIEKGIEKGRAITVIKLLTKKFGTLPEEVKTKISGLDNATLEVIIDGIFEYRSLDDIKKYIE